MRTTAASKQRAFLKFETRTGQPRLPIGERMKARRKDLGLTLQELAARSGLSAAFISQAERSLTTPSVWSLLNLAKGLDVDVSYFMEWPQTDEIVFRAAQPKRIDIGSPVEYIDLASDLPDRKLTPFWSASPPVSPSRPSPSAARFSVTLSRASCSRWPGTLKRCSRPVTACISTAAFLISSATTPTRTSCCFMWERLRSWSKASRKEADNGCRGGRWRRHRCERPLMVDYRRR